MLLASSWPTFRTTTFTAGRFSWSLVTVLEVFPR
jgi:hypothetical protein